MLLVLDEDILDGDARRETILHRTHFRLRTQRARELLRHQVHCRRLHPVTRQHAHDHTAYKQYAYQKDGQYVPKPLHLQIGYKGTTKIAYMQIFEDFLTLFRSNCGKITMSGIDTDIRREGKEVLEGRDQLSHITSRQVRSTVTHLEEGVS